MPRSHAPPAQSPAPFGRWQILLAGAFVAVQILVPLAVGTLAEHRPTVFGWQMFARGTQRVAFELETDAGVVRFRPKDVLMKDRGDIPFRDVIPPILCRRPGAIAVTIETPDGRTRRPCD